eukprot:gnl/MRDRNA2_/MRDRNA2_191771_c0_seq1.p1 gnl/MRDRNA2_/MRDRNA2_191771_c0~~gnl/MRDRNA2_/MRDRNA2_191771_c0_seq1.p1  ORF type:complete len:305 (+),score=50.46 gnl/MRDRNA2_/MRDRNA2_191771_c0_seq1:83-997(+)
MGVAGAMSVAVMLVTFCANAHARQISGPFNTHPMVLYSGGMLSFDNLATKFFDRVLAASLHNLDTHLEGTTLGKPGHLSTSGSAGTFFRSPRLITSAVTPSPFRGMTSRREYGIPCNAHQDDNIEPQPVKAQLLGRRHAFLGPVGFALAAALQAPALASDPGFTDAPEGLQYRDDIVGNGAVPFDGDTLTVCDEPGTCGELKAGDGDLMAKDPRAKGAKYIQGFTFTLGKDEVIKGWEKAVLGAGNMPPMKVGGTRTVIIPSKLAYGAKGLGCKAQDEDGGEDCTIPPYATVEFTIQLVKIARA